MKKFLFLDLKTIIIILEFIIIVLLKSGCGGNKPVGGTIRVDGKKYVVVQHTVDTVDVEKIKYITKRGSDIYHDTTIYVPIYGPIDTMEIIRQYYAKNIYKDTLNLGDSLGFVYLNDTISENKILFRNFESRIKQRIVKDVSIVKELPKRQLFYGFNIGLNKPQLFSSVETGLIYKDRKDNILQFNVGVSNGDFSTYNNGLIPFIKVGSYWKIKVKK
jgi:hypothetical protein